MHQEIENRISRRSFLNEPLTEQQRQEIGAYIREQNAVSQLTVSFLEDGSCAFGNIKTTYGMFSNVRSMLLLKGMADMPDLKEKIGYYGEDLALFLTGMGLGTCWVGGTYDKEALDVRPDEELVCVLLVGKVKKASVKEKLLRSTLRGKVKSMQERMIADRPLPQWVRDGMQAVLLAPSARNSQKTIFHFENGQISAQIEDDYRFDLVDLGIAKKHFEIEAGGRFDWGNGGVFHPAQT